MSKNNQRSSNAGEHGLLGEDMQTLNTFSVNQWSTFRRSFSLRPLKLLTATYCSVPTAISSFYFCMNVFYFVLFLYERDGHQHDFTLHVKGDVCI